MSRYFVHTNLLNGVRKCVSDDYNYIFYMRKNEIVRYGKDASKPPKFSHYGPDTISVEVVKNTTIMSLETFKRIIESLPKIISRVYIYGDESCTLQPTLFTMMRYLRTKKLSPIFVGGVLSSGKASIISRICDSVVINYYNKESFQSINNLGQAETKNIEMVLDLSNIDSEFKLFYDIQNSPDLDGLCNIQIEANNIERFNGDFDALFYHLMNLGLFTISPCANIKISNQIEMHPRKCMIETHVEECDACKFSIHIDVNGNIFPCTKSKTIIGNILSDGVSFEEDIWNADKNQEFRSKKGCVLV